MCCLNINIIAFQYYILVSSVKPIPRSWVKNPIEDVLWCVKRLNNMHVSFDPSGSILWAYCGPDELDAFKKVTMKFCLVCRPFEAG